MPSFFDRSLCFALFESTSAWLTNTVFIPQNAKIRHTSFEIYRIPASCPSERYSNGASFLFQCGTHAGSNDGNGKALAKVNRDKRQYAPGKSRAECHPGNQHILCRSGNVAKKHAGQCEEKHTKHLKNQFFLPCFAKKEFCCETDQQCHQRI